MEPQLLDAEWAAKYLSVSRATVYKLIDSGDLRGIKIGRARRFSVRELDLLVERLERERGVPR